MDTTPTTSPVAKTLGTIAITALVVATGTWKAMSSDAVLPDDQTVVTYSKTDDQTIHTSKKSCYTVESDDKVADLKISIDTLETSKATLDSNPHSIPVEKIDFLIDEEKRKLEGGASVGMTDADTAIKDLGIQ